MTDREHFAALLADAKIMFWTCLNKEHRRVTWTGDVATCDTCGLTSEMTARFARAVQAYERERIAGEVDPEFPSTWAGGHALVIEFGDEELIARCQCGAPLGTGVPSTPLDTFGLPWERHVMGRHGA